MVTVLRTLSILSLVSAGLLFLLSIQRELHADDPSRLSDLPSAIEAFTQSSAKSPTEGADHVPRLVEQARILALYLSPPVPRPPAGDPPRRMVVTPPVANKPASAAQVFELHGISYHRAKPEESIALICEPGGQRRWVRQGMQLGHLAIERITGISVICRDGDRVREIALATDEALVRYAKDNVRSVVPAAKPLRRPDPSRSSPLPQRGICQMPASRVAARMGLTLTDVDLPGVGRTESR